MNEDEKTSLTGSFNYWKKQEDLLTRLLKKLREKTISLPSEFVREVTFENSMRMMTVHPSGYSMGMKKRRLRFHAMNSDRPKD